MKRASELTVGEVVFLEPTLSRLELSCWKAGCILGVVGLISHLSIKL